MRRAPDHLDERLRAHYEAKALDADTLRRLKATIEASGSAEAEPASGSFERPFLKALRRLHGWVRRPAVVAMAAVAALVAVASALYLLPAGAPATQAWAVASEIALNHNKQLPSEFAAADVAELGAAMSKLDFAPVHPERLKGGGYRLLGGRYCSVGRAIAAQIRLTDEAGRPHTLYQFRSDETSTGLDGVEMTIDGVRVTIWREAGLVMGLAQPVS